MERKAKHLREKSTTCQIVKDVKNTMKDATYRARCIEKVLNQHSSFDVMLGLADIAFDIFIISLKEKNPTITREEIRREIKEISEWRRTTSKN